MRLSLTLLCIITSAALLSGCGGSNNGGVVLNGSGATFPAPVYASWSYQYGISSSGRVQVNYQGVGSGAGVNQLKEGTVDFAGTDSPLTAEELEESQLVQIPMVGGGVVIVVNLPNVKTNQLNISPSVLADIFAGKIKQWNAAEIQTDNPQIQLPNLPITVVHRSDASGTSFLFTHYLSKVSESWKNEIGTGKTVAWACGIGGQKNPGVCNNVSKINGAIGYTEYTYAVEAKLSCAKLKNAAGNFIAPTPESFSAALESVDWKSAPGNCVILTDALGDKSYPLAAISYLLYRNNLAQEKQAALFDYINWCFGSGNQQAKELHYIPLSGKLVKGIYKQE